MPDPSRAHQCRCLALDLGATSGRAIEGIWDGHTLTTREVARFANAPAPSAHGLTWNIDRICEQALAAVGRSAAEGPLDGVACDAWAMDHGFIDGSGKLLQPPFCYQDGDRARLGEKVLMEKIAPKDAESIYRQAGAPYITISTLHQMLATQETQPGILRASERLLMIPELIAHWLCGEQVAEFSTASTTSLTNYKIRDWNRDFISQLGIPKGLFAPLSPAGTTLAKVRHRRTNLPDLHTVPVHLVAGHDTASAFVGSGGGSAGELLISSGTWLMLAFQVAEPMLSREAYEQTIGCYGVPGGWMLVCGIMGLYLLERLRSEEGWGSIHDLCAEARTAKSFQAVFDPSTPALTQPGRLRDAILMISSTPSGAEPQRAEFVRGILESLALFTADRIDAIEKMTGTRIDRIRVTGGGARNALLNQMIANAANRPLIAVEPEGAARGNLILQLMALGEIRNLEDARQATLAGMEEYCYQPRDEGWTEAREVFARSRGKKPGRARASHQPSDY